jgi:predicted  nucleic acid-binding Zn-ribbon protein
MSEESTQNLPPRSFEERVLDALSAIRAEQSAIRADVAALGERMSSLERKVDSLEEKVDRRLQETRPVWESVQAQIRKLDTKFDIVIRELYEIRYDHVILGKRVDELEKTSSQ